MESTCFLLDFPYELLLDIVHRLDPDDVIQLQMVRA